LFRKLTLVVTVISVLTTLFTSTAAANEQNAECRIRSSENHLVSIGFPIRKERLFQLDKPKVLVIPFQLSDEPDYEFKDSFKLDYQSASEIIHNLSDGKVRVEFNFAKPLITNLTNADMEIQKLNQQSSWMTDPEKSTWGLVRRLVKASDSGIDFRGYNAVILEGSATSRYSDINEAMSFQDNPQNPWFKSIQTDEGLISNAILLDNHAFPSIIAHEVMHLFGLTDLYGSPDGPGRLSLMSNMESSLLTFEKWVLGWHPDSRVTCVTNLPSQGALEVKMDLKLGGHLAVIPTTLGSGYILDVSKHKNSLFVSFYLLNNELRPPIQLFRSPTDRNQQGLPLSEVSTVGQVLKGPEFSAVVTEIQGNLLTVSLLKTSNLESTESQSVLKRATENISTSRPYIPPQESVKETPDGSSSGVQVKDLQDPSALSKPLGVTKKKTSILCTKGKSVIKVTSLQPKCPRGYKLKK